MTSNRYWSVASIAFVAAGCAVDANPAAPSGLAGPGKPESTAAPASEDVRVQSFLDGMYRAEDVLHSFHSAAGQDIDCVDFAREPGVRAMLAEGHSLDELREGAPLTKEQLEYNKTAPKAPRPFLGEPDEAGRTRECPAGSVPHVRVTRERIQAHGGLDAYVAATTKKALPPRAVVNPQLNCPYADVDDYQWVTGGWSGNNNAGVGNQGGQATMAIAQPTIQPYVSDHSLAETWTIGQSGCTVQTVEAGWTVDDALNDDYVPHIFIFSTAATFGAGNAQTGAVGCYNNSGSSCVTWIPGATSPYYPGAPLTPGEPGGKQHEMAVSTQHVTRLSCILIGQEVQCSNPYVGWQVAVSVDGAAWESLGYYASSAYGTGPLATGATDYELGSEASNSSGNSSVAVGSPGVTMGEAGIFFTQTSYYGTNSYFHDYSLFSPANATPPGTVGAWVGVGEKSETCETWGTCAYTYTTADTEPAGAATWKNWWYYGDTIPLFIRR